ncbi:hypothetical protein GX50_06511 [[Emmonsia] crescens]|uniref:Uncharacterized protein n=1 Tax=[Emmonsia] crescens TaxID=73230 RepID=A0A2B7ZC22_9EURO|nr:hypothetical protein GX50_06511 [Emmonsia crescens]
MVKTSAPAPTGIDVPDFGRTPCEKCLPRMGDVEFRCELPPGARKRCGPCAQNHLTCKQVKLLGCVKRLMYLRGAVWFGARVGRACSPERRELADLVNQVDAPRVSRLRARGRKAAAAGVAKRRAAALALEVGDEKMGGMVEMAGVKVPAMTDGVGEGPGEEEWGTSAESASDEESDGEEVVGAESAGDEESGAGSAGVEEVAGAVSAGEEGDVESGDKSPGEEEENFWAKCRRLYKAQDGPGLEPLYEMWLGVKEVKPCPQAMAEFLRLVNE